MQNPFDNWKGNVTIDGRYVANRRKLCDMDPETLANKACVGKSTIEKWEAYGVCNAQIDNIRSVAAVLGFDLRDALTSEFRQKIERMAQQARNHTAASKKITKGQSDPSVSNRRFQLLPELPDFVGRDDVLHEIVEQFRGNRTGVGISSLRGMGGVGKTTIAVHVAHRIKDLFPDAQLFLDLQGVSDRPVTPVEAMTRFIHDFDPTIRELPITEDELLPIYRTTLADKRALIVLDNAGSEAQVKHLIAGDANGFIITSRNSLALDGVPPVAIDVFEPAKSLELLRVIVEERGTDNELNEVAQLCGHLPLALRVAGHFIRLKKGWSVDQYIAALKEERLRWLKVGNDPQKDVEAVLKLSAAQLVRDDVELATRWHYLGDWQSDFAPAAAAAAWGINDNLTVLDDLSRLVDRSLVLFDENTFRYRLHDLMKPIAEGLFA